MTDQLDPSANPQLPSEAHAACSEPATPIDGLDTGLSATPHDAAMLDASAARSVDEPRRKHRATGESRTVQFRPDAIELLISLVLLGEATKEQLLAIHFPNSSLRRIERYLKPLVDQGLVIRRVRYGFDKKRSVPIPLPHAYRLSEAGHMAVLHDPRYPVQTGKDEYRTRLPNPETTQVQEHDLVGSSVISALALSARKQQLSGMFLRREQQLDPQARAPRIDMVLVVHLHGPMVRPGAFVWTKNPPVAGETQWVLAIEIDRNTEAISIIRGKALRYQEALARQRTQEYWQSHYSQVPTILWIAPTERRLLAIQQVWQEAWPKGLWILATPQMICEDRCVVYQGSKRQLHEAQLFYSPTALAGIGPGWPAFPTASLHPPKQQLKPKASATLSDSSAAVPASSPAVLPAPAAAATGTSQVDGTQQPEKPPVLGNASPQITRLPLKIWITDWNLKSVETRATLHVFNARKQLVTVAPYFYSGSTVYIPQQESEQLVIRLPELDIETSCRITDKVARIALPWRFGPVPWNTDKVSVDQQIFQAARRALVTPRSDQVWARQQFWEHYYLLKRDRYVAQQFLTLSYGYSGGRRTLVSVFGTIGAMLYPLNVLASVTAMLALLSYIGLSWVARLCAWSALTVWRMGWRNPYQLIGRSLVTCLICWTITFGLVWGGIRAESAWHDWRGKPCARIVEERSVSFTMPDGSGAWHVLTVPSDTLIRCWEDEVFINNAWTRRIRLNNEEPTYWVLPSTLEELQRIGK
jgi:hypothetical protein